MPTISAFFGIFDRMYFDDHGPPHFHAYYEDDMIVVEIGTGKVLAGGIPPRAKALLMEWALLHREELMEDWRLASDHRPLKKISPLE